MGLTSSWKARRSLHNGSPAEARSAGSLQNPASTNRAPSVSEGACCPSVSEGACWPSVSEGAVCPSVSEGTGSCSTQSSEYASYSGRSAAGFRHRSGLPKSSKKCQSRSSTLCSSAFSGENRACPRLQRDKQVSRTARRASGDTPLGGCTSSQLPIWRYWHSSLTY